MSTHAQSLRLFSRRLTLLLMVRGAVQWVTVWLFVWGVVVIAARIAGFEENRILLAGLSVAVPLAVCAAFLAWRNRTPLSTVRAAYDGLNQCGGMVMAEEAADMSAWRDRSSAGAVPVVRWQSRRSLALLGIAVLFTAVSFLLPARLNFSNSQTPLQVGKLVGELKTEVEVLKDEKLLEDKKADEIQKQLVRLKEDSSAVDPSKTWEALDHIKEANSELARHAAEEAISKMSSLTQAEMLASAMEMASDSGMTPDTAMRAAEALAGIMRAAKLEEGLMQIQIPPELLAQAGQLNREELEKLLSSIDFSKARMMGTMTNLANLRLIDARTLRQGQSAGLKPNPNALAEYLSQCTNAADCDLASLCYGAGGPGGGGGTGPMTWQNPSSETGVQFQEEVLPPATRLSDAELVGVSRSAPDLSDADAAVESGALSGAKGAGGSANSQPILPRHRQAVEKFFKRDQ